MKILFIILAIIIFNCGVPFTQDCHINNYTTEQGLPQNNLTQLMFDSNFKLWIGTQGGLCVFDGQQIKQITHETLSPRINFIHKENNLLYIIDGMFNLYHTNKYDIKLVKLNPKSKTAEAWIYNKFNPKRAFITNKPDHYIYFLIHQMSYKNIKKFKENETEYYINNNKNHSNLITAFLIDSVMVGLDNNGKWFKFTTYGIPTPLLSELPLDFHIKGLIFNTDINTFWLYKNKIHELKLVKNQLKPVIVIKNVVLDKLKHQISIGQYNQNNGNFYFGSSKYGLFEVSPAKFKVKKHSSESKELTTFGFGAAYYSQSEIKPNSIFVNNYFLLQDAIHTQVTSIIYPNNRAVNFIDSKGWLWYSDNQNIIIQKGKLQTKITLAPLVSPIVSMSEIEKNKYLLLNSNSIIMTDSSKEIKRINIRTFQDTNQEFGQFLHYDKITKEIYLLSNKKIYVVNLKTQKLIPEKSITNADYRIMSSLTDSLKFIGTYGQGYLIYDGKKWYPMPLDKKGHLKFAHAALVDDHGHVWISTNNGLFRTCLQDMMDYTQGKAQDIFYYYYDKSSGFLTNEFNGGCQSPAIKLRDGRFSFSSMDGLVQFAPLKVPAIFPDKLMHIIDLSLNGQQQDSIPPRLEITQDIKDIKLEISTAYYGHPDNLVIQYKIPGYVESWTDLTDKRYIILQNANHGSFNIEIRKRRGFGAQDFDYLYYPISVLPYFYQTWWFMVCIGLGFVLIIVIAARWYSRNLATQKLKLEKMVQDRNQSLIDINISLEDKIKQNEMFHSVMVHDIKAPLFFMGTISDEILKGMDHLSKDDIRNNISSVKQAASHLNNFIINFLTWVKSKNDNLALQKEMVNLSELMHELKTFYSHTDKIMKERLSIVLDFDDNITVKANRQLLMIVLGNLLSNSIKFSTQGTITLYAYITGEGSTVIGCKDQGKGMSSETIALLKSSQYKGNAIREDSFRMGYVFINDIIKMMNATLSIYSIQGEGTDVSIEISL